MAAQPVACDGSLAATLQEHLTSLPNIPTSDSVWATARTQERHCSKLHPPTHPPTAHPCIVLVRPGRKITSAWRPHSPSFFVYAMRQPPRTRNGIRCCSGKKGRAGECIRKLCVLVTWLTGEASCYSGGRKRAAAAVRRQRGS